MCEAANELQKVRAKLVGIGNLILAHDEDAGDLTSYELLVKIEAFVKDLSRPVKDLCLRGLWSKGGGTARIAEERMRQVVVEGWTPGHDDGHAKGELRDAAECYLLELRARNDRGQVIKRPPPAWPWDVSWWKPSDDPVRSLMKAGALIAAEIDRLRRMGGSEPVPMPLPVAPAGPEAVHVQLPLMEGGTV